MKKVPICAKSLRALAKLKKVFDTPKDLVSSALRFGQSKTHPLHTLPITKIAKDPSLWELKHGKNEESADLRKIIASPGQAEKGVRYSKRPSFICTTVWPVEDTPFTHTTDHKNSKRSLFVGAKTRQK